MSNRPSWTNPVLWVLALLLINALWSQVVQQEAPNEINAADQFSTFREINVAPVFGSQAPMPATLTTVFSSISVQEANVSVALKLNNETDVFAWSGTLAEEPPVWTGQLEPGTYTVVTKVDDGVDVEQTLSLEPFETVRWQGHVVLSVLLVVIAVLEQAVRRLLAARQTQTAKTPVQTSPFRPATHRPEADVAWEESDSPWREPWRGS